MTISFVQSKQTSPSGSATSAAGTLTTGATLGNLLVAAVAVGNNTVTITGPTGWTQAVINQPAKTSATIEASIWFLVVGAADAGKTSWTWTFSASHTNYITITEFSSTNGWPANPLDQSAQGDTVATPTQATLVDSGTTPTTTQASELWFAALAYKGSAQTETSVTSGWTSDVESTFAGNNTLRDCYQIVTTTGAADCSLTIGTAAYWAGAAATFKDNAVTTSTHAVPASAALLATNTRAASASAALLATTTRQASASAALLRPDLARATPASAALQATVSRSAPASAALQALGVTRTASAQAALLQSNLARVAPVSAALLLTLARVMPAGAALRATQTRAAPASAALLATATRTASAQAALIATNTRAVPTSVALSSALGGGTRLTPVSAALLATLTRQTSAQVALLQPDLLRTVPTTGALLAIATRAAPTSAALRASLTRHVIPTAVLVATIARLASAQAALLATQTRGVPATAQLSGASGVALKPSGSAIVATGGPSGLAAALLVASVPVGASAAVVAAIPAGVSTVGAANTPLGASPALVGAGAPGGVAVREG